MEELSLRSLSEQIVKCFWVHNSSKTVFYTNYNIQTPVVYGSKRKRKKILHYDPGRVDLRSICGLTKNPNKTTRIGVLVNCEQCATTMRFPRYEVRNWYDKITDRFKPYC